MLLALSDFANDEGVCYPSVKTLAAMCRISVRHANRVLAALQKSGEIAVRLNAGRYGTNVYVIRPSVPKETTISSEMKKTPPLNPVVEQGDSAEFYANMNQELLKFVFEEKQLAEKKSNNSSQ